METISFLYGKICAICVHNPCSCSTSIENGGASGVVGLERSKFQQMISDAVTNAQQRNSEHNEYVPASRRRIGSGRIVADTESDVPEWANCGPIS